MLDCKFCNRNPQDLANTIIEETEHFYLMPATGCLVDGYLLVISKRHLYSMSTLTESEKSEYFSLLAKYRKHFFDIYGNYPIIFEHGSVPLQKDTSASSIFHAHTHIVNHLFQNENKLLDDLNLSPLSSFPEMKQNYIFYLNPQGKLYLSTHFPAVSQLMRRRIATDLGILEQYNWKTHEFPENLAKTIQNFTNKKISPN